MPLEKDTPGANALKRPFCGYVRQKTKRPSAPSASCASPAESSASRQTLENLFPLK